MRVVFEDDDLRRPAEDASYAPRPWGTDVIKAYWKKIQVLRAAIDERDLRAMRSLRLERLKGNRAGTSSIRLNDQLRVIVNVETADDGRMVIVIEMVDDH